MLDLRNIKALNALFRKFQTYGESYNENIGKGLKNISSFSKIITKDIPSLLHEMLSDDKYKVTSSIGQGRITKCPWIAILNKEETGSTQHGVYVVFLFSKDLKKIYLTLAQGVKDTIMNEISHNRDKIRLNLGMSNTYLLEDNKIQISNDDYSNSAIYSTVWDCSDDEKSKDVFQNYLLAYDRYMISKRINKRSVPKVKPDSFSLLSFISLINETGLLYSSTLIKRFVFSLLSKRFLILSGLAGSGKTQLALAIASALIENDNQMKVVSVGADWTNREPLLGFPNALHEGSYVEPECGALQLLIEANKPENADKPYFLILDEMNMSYVERYFADFLSSMESHQPISLWNGGQDSDIPAEISLPTNLFIIGTINVDETTYMFSPKVLDRANVIEFKISEDEMEEFLSEIKPVDRDCIKYKAASMGKTFVALSSKKDLADDEAIKDILCSFFRQLKSVNAEFGYRSASEIYRFISQATCNDDTEQKLTLNQILDCAIVQKLLPKLHGSRKKLEPVLQALWKECFDGPETKEIMSISQDNVGKAKYPLTADKIQRMYEAAYANGFTSFAEA